MAVLWIDLETRSRALLETCGTYNYASDSSTTILVACYAIDNGPIETWTLHSGKAIPSQLVKALKDPGVTVCAHNATFERLLLKHVWHIDIPPARWCCTMTQARACALPGSLKDVGRALAAKLQKEARGLNLIKLLSVPQEDGNFLEDPHLLAQFADYCRRDVAVMRATSKALPPLTEEARQLYAVSEAINDRGLAIDIELCRLAIGYAEEERAEAKANVAELTEGACLAATGTGVTHWLHERLPAPAQALMTIERRQSKSANRGERGANPRGQTMNEAEVEGEKKPSLTLDADTRAALFALAEENPEDYAQPVLAVLEATDAVQSTSVHKFKRLLATAGADGRLRGAFIVNGASGTGRFSSHSAQLHNFPRKCAQDPEAIKGIMRGHGRLPGPVMECLKSMLRPVIFAGTTRRIVLCDWNAIEARALPWLTKRASAEHCLNAFRDPARDLYVEDAQACGLGNNRNAGKVVRLALGYGGSVGALSAMCKAYGVAMDAKLEVVQRWRSANRWAVEWWSELYRAACSALAAPIAGQWFAAGRVRFARQDWGEGRQALVMALPSQRLLYYPDARLDEEGLSYLKAGWKPREDATEWPRGRMWGGMLAENACQASCADLLREALVRAVDSGLPIVGHVHDEIICEAPAEDAPAVGLLLHSIMLTLPEWAEGLPLAAETHIAPRYRK